VYAFSTSTIGSVRRCALSASRARVSSFSFASSARRAVSHSARDTTVDDSMFDSCEIFGAVAATRARRRRLMTSADTPADDVVPAAASANVEKQMGQNIARP
jgi:hypothetical protein